MKNSKTFAALAAAIMAVSSIGVVAYADAATDSAAAPVATENTAPAETPAESQAEVTESAAPAESQAEESKAEESAAPAESKADESKAEESAAPTESKADESKTESKAEESKKDDTSSKADAVIAKILYDAFTGNEFAYDVNGNFLAAYSSAGARLDGVKPSGILYGFAGEDKTAGDIVFYDASNLSVVKTVVRSSVTGSVADFAKTVINDLNKTTSATKTTGNSSKTESKKDDKSSSKSEEKKKDNPKTGNTAANSIVGLVTLAGAAALAVISRKERD